MTNLNETTNFNIHIKKFNHEDANWSQVRTQTVSNLYDDWKSRNDSDYVIFNDSKLEDNKLAMLKLKELEDLISENNKLILENKNLIEKVSKHQTAISVIKNFIKFEDLEKSRGLMEQILALV